MLQLSGLARSTFYYYIQHPIKDKYKKEKQEILYIFLANKGRYGYRRILIVLRQKGYTINHKTVLKLMKELNLKGKQRKNSKYRSYKGEIGKIADNLLNREFTATKPFEKLATDVTEFKVCNDKVYLIQCGWSAEELAIRNIKNGIFPPESGTHCNPFNEWIGAQMRAGVCGMTAPGRPYIAAMLAWRDGEVSHANNGILGEVFSNDFAGVCG